MPLIWPVEAGGRTLVVAKKRSEPHDRLGRGPLVCFQHVRGDAHSRDQRRQLHHAHAQHESITACALKLHAVMVFLTIDRS